ncbi:MAG: serine/threonine-protein phosphatase [Ruminococcaceae bacterium]|nr:serine/threonine-protein phosphatase [Oscillospiraceae bacterium]
MGFVIEYHCMSDTGRIRTKNQDNFLCRGQFMEADNRGCGGISGTVAAGADAFAVFDGLGGEEAGEVAASIAAKLLSQVTFSADAEASLRGFCADANAAICAYTAEHLLTSMGTTAAILRFGKKSVTLCNIGDSRIHRLRGGELTQLSVDHVSLARAGMKPPLSQNLGIPETELRINPHFASLDYRDGDVYLISSDGLTDMVKPEEMADILKNSPHDASVRALVDAALTAGGRDNVTVIVIYIRKKKLFERIK